MKDPHYQRKAGYGMIAVAASLALIGLLQVTIGPDVLFGDKIQRATTATFEECNANGFQEPQCAKWLDEKQFTECMANDDADSPECWKHRTWVIQERELKHLKSLAGE